jgi:hypothetical protein
LDYGAVSRQPVEEPPRTKAGGPKEVMQRNTWVLSDEEIGETISDKCRWGLENFERLEVRVSTNERELALGQCLGVDGQGGLLGIKTYFVANLPGCAKEEILIVGIYSESYRTGAARAGLILLPVAMVADVVLFPVYLVVGLFR